jgi:ELWxxDGT repeat protein
MRSLALLALGPLLIFSAQALAQNEPFLVKDIRPGSTGSEPGRLANLNGTLLFSANDGILGEELWKSDGTAEGTVLVKDINPGLESGFSGNFYPWSPAKVNGTLFFAADDGSTGYELWKSDGTAEGTVLVKDINPGSNGSTPKYCANLNGTLFFGASEGVFGRELWRSDGTEAGTVLVKDIRPGAESTRAGWPHRRTNSSSGR